MVESSRDRHPVHRGSGVIAPQDAHRRLQRILRQSTPPRRVIDRGERADLAAVADQQVDRG
jgi:hypothetical protein